MSAAICMTFFRWTTTEFVSLSATFPTKVSRQLFFMAMTRTAFKISAMASPESIALTMGRVNQFLCESNPQQMFVAAFAGILDLRTGHIDYSDAGHELPLHPATIG